MKGIEEVNKNRIIVLYYIINFLGIFIKRRNSQLEQLKLEQEKYRERS